MKNSVDFWWQMFFHIFPMKNGLNFVTSKTSENFTTFSTAKKLITWSSLWGRLHVTNCRKLQEIARGFQGSRTKSASVVLPEDSM